jgi:hypothetical protein
MLAVLTFNFGIMKWAKAPRCASSNESSKMVVLAALFLVSFVNTY